MTELPRRTSGSIRGTCTGAPRSGTGTAVFLFAVQDTAGIAVNATRIYWTEPAKGMVRSALLDGSAVMVHSSNEGAPAALTKDASALYWVSPGSGEVRKMRLDTGQVVTIASGQNQPNAIAVNGTSVYWINQGDGSVWRAPK